MRLKRLILQGYKTFATKTEFRFDEGITSIIGPNGSGKSNIADAVRWVLGEQSYSTLRGKRTVDMIFTGSRSRSRAGMAQVILTLDNDDGWLPIDFSEVEIGRRAFRSGENEYILNGQKVRLRDITDLLATSGLSERTYTIIGQGLVDQALSLRAEERRALFEEAAGISHYKAKRAQTIRRLEETQRNLERVHDILAEIKPRMNSLRRQAVRARNYEQIATDLREQLRLWYGYLWEQQKEDLKMARLAASSAGTGWKEGRRQLTSLTKKVDEEKRLLQRQQDQVATTRTSREELLSRLESARREQAVLGERQHSIRRQLAEIEQESPVLGQQQAAAESDLGEAVAALEQAQKQLKESKAVLEQSDSTRELRLARSEVDALRSARAKARTSARMMDNELKRLQQKVRAAEARLNKRRNDLARVEARVTLLNEMRHREAGIPPEVKLIGRLKHAISFPSEYATALEAALRSRLATLIVRKPNELWRLFDLSDPDRSLAAVALDSVQPADEPKMPPDSALIDWLPNLVECEPEIKPVVQLLLGKTLLAACDAQSAYRIAEQLPDGTSVVTESGFIARAGGLVERPGNEISSTELSMEKEQQKAEAAVSAIQEELSGLESAVTQQLQLVDTKRDQLDEALSKVEQLAQAESEKHQRAADVQRRQQGLRQDVNSTQTIVAGRQAVADSRRATLNQVSRQQTRLAERKESLMALQQRQVLMDTNAMVESLQQELEKVDEKLAGHRPILAEHRTAVARLEEEVSHIRSRNYQQETKHTQAQIALTQQQARAEGLQERIKAELGVVALIYDDDQTGPTPLPMSDVVEQLPQVEEIPDDIEETIQQYRGQMQRMGAINPEAPTEFDETKERFDFLTQQVEDMNQTGAQLQQVISELDELTSRAFVETVEKVNKVFGTTFTELFGGGSARLTLIDPEDLTNSGVDIIARLPNRREQGLALLSGGERSLTAVALIFSLLKVAPTPFCVLDEVDAALDEANINRFRELLGELSSNTQFIVITHNRGTVQAAQTLYGISMGIDGTSQAISIKPEEYVSQETLV